MDEGIIKAIEAITKRGNDAEVRRKGNGYIVLEVLRFSRRLALSFSIKPARYSGFYTIYRRDELRTKERKIEQWHLHANF